MSRWIGAQFCARRRSTRAAARRTEEVDGEQRGRAPCRAEKTTSTANSFSEMSRIAISPTRCCSDGVAAAPARRRGRAGGERAGGSEGTRARRWRRRSARRKVATRVSRGQRSTRNRRAATRRGHRSQMSLHVAAPTRDMEASGGRRSIRRNGASASMTRKSPPRPLVNSISSQTSLVANEELSPPLPIRSQSARHFSAS